MPKILGLQFIMINNDQEVDVLCYVEFATLLE
jgi:hypothetical protein